MSGFHKYGSGMDTGKVEHKSFAWFCNFFQIENFQDLEARADITPCHYIIESNKQAIK